MRESSKAALCGIISSLAVVIMLSTYISPLLVYTAPAFSGLLLLLIINELGCRWAFGTYITVSLISAFIIADKEAAVFYTMFFGFYPILGYILNKNIRNKIIRTALKLITFNFSCLVSFAVCMYVLSIDMSDILGDGILFTVVFACLMNILFVIYDILIIRLQELYIKKLQKKFRKLFNIR